MSLVLPSLEIMPLGTWRVTAPVLTSYREVTLGRMVLEGSELGYEDVELSDRASRGRAATALMMARVKAEDVRNCILVGDDMKLVKMRVCCEADCGEAVVGAVRCRWTNAVDASNQQQHL